LRSESAPWATPNNKKTSAVAIAPQNGRELGLASCQFNEHINCLPWAHAAGPRARGDHIFLRKKNRAAKIAQDLPFSACIDAILSSNHTCRTEACHTWLIAPFTGHTAEMRAGPSLDRRGSHVYSSIIRTGNSPPYNRVAWTWLFTGTGFLCLRCKEGGNLVECLCVSCGWACLDSGVATTYSGQHQICSYIVLLFSREEVRFGCTRRHSAGR
jgi:hypothetical protein